jgi:glutaminyl-peptide cyclotransferase
MDQGLIARTFPVLRSLFALAALLLLGAQTAAPVAIYDVRVVHRYPHDPAAFTQGLFFRDGRLYESTGLNGRSSIREVDLRTGAVLRQRALEQRHFGEGIIDWRDEIIALTWRGGEGLVFGLADFAPRRTFRYSGEGWGLTRDDRRIIMSDGTSELRFLDPTTLRETRRVTVTLRGRPLREINELEWINGEVFANVWQTNNIVRIDPDSGRVTGAIDLTGLLPAAERTRETDVLNGIATLNGRIFVTGKNWPWLYEIELVPRVARAQ